jgi:hypothetical protein
MFERGHVKSRLADTIHKDSKHLKNALPHASSIQMLQSNKELLSVLKVGSAKYYVEVCQSLLCVNCKPGKTFCVTRRNY